MEREAIEFHDSVLARIERDGDQIHIFFAPAYVHRSSGDPARDAGTGWSANVALIVSQSSESTFPSNLPCHVWDGTLAVAGSEFQNVVPVPFEGEGEVVLSCELTSGEVAKVSGKSVRLMVTGAYKFIEDVPAG